MKVYYNGNLVHLLLIYALAIGHFFKSFYVYIIIIFSKIIDILIELALIN